MATHPHAPVNLAALAQQAGVHPSTASRALSEHPVGVSARTVARIRALAAELGYSRDITGASLRTGRTRMIGVLVPRLTDVVMAAIYEAIDEAAANAGYNTVVANTQDDGDLQRMRLQGLLSRRVDGLIIGDSREGTQIPDRLTEQQTPFTLVMRRLGDFPSVSTDDLEGGRLAARHLLELGHRRVGVVAGDALTSTGAERTRGFAEAFERAGYPLAHGYVVGSGFDVGSGREAGDRLLALDPSPTAIFAVNDFTAIGVMGALRDAGRHVGADTALIGYNDVSIVSELPVPLSSVRSPLREMGQKSVEALLRRIDGKEVTSIQLSPTLVARASTLGVRRPHD